MSTQIQSIENERKLIEACKRGDHRAFEQIYVKYKERIYSLCIYMSGDRETAKDLNSTNLLKSLYFFAFLQIWLTIQHLAAALGNECLHRPSKEN